MFVQWCETYRVNLHARALGTTINESRGAGTFKVRSRFKLCTGLTDGIRSVFFQFLCIKYKLYTCFRVSSIITGFIAPVYKIFRDFKL